ncbi:MAG: hypothetical protein FWF29_07975, partial [Treponema sp.]|nr:hypothetical protein [Treponema sp.]
APIDPITLTGNMVEFPEAVAGNPTAITMTMGNMYQGTANTGNMLGNPNFATDGAKGFVGNWGSGNWKETKFTAPSPGSNPPAPKCLYLPQSDGVKDVMQRVPVEPGSWYYVSVWCYSEIKGPGTMITLALYGNPGDGYGPNALARMNVNARLFLNANKWSQAAFIVQIPAVDSIDTANNPCLDIRFRQAPDADTPATYFTKAEIYKLLPETVAPVSE